MGREPVEPPQESQAVDHTASNTGLRAVAIFESVKGIAVIGLAIALIAYHDHIEDLAEDLLYNLHVDFDRRWAQAFMKGATRLSDMRLWSLLTVAFGYAVVRFVEAWGLWNRRVWAEWFALLSGALYLPLEILKVVERASWERVGVLVLNLVIVIYMAEIRIREARKRKPKRLEGPAV